MPQIKMEISDDTDFLVERQTTPGVTGKTVSKIVNCVSCMTEVTDSDS